MSQKQPLISAIIIADLDWFNSVKMITDCLKSISWIDEKIILAAKYTKEFEFLAKKSGVKFKIQRGNTFAEWRNEATEYAEGKWLFYIDSDERVPDQLKQEISITVTSNFPKSAYAIPRSNFILGKDMRHGGWWPDYVLRLMQKTKLEKWEGDLHEQPKIKGEIGHLTNPLLHIKFQKLEDYVDKTLNWSDTEGKLMFTANHPKMNVRRFLRPLLTEIFSRLIVKKGILDGTEGLIDGIYQGFSRFISYSKLWEKQLKINN